MSLYDDDTLVLRIEADVSADSSLVAVRHASIGRKIDRGDDFISPPLASRSYEPPIPSSGRATIRCHIVVSPSLFGETWAPDYLARKIQDSIVQGVCERRPDAHPTFDAGALVPLVADMQLLRTTSDID